MKIGGGSKRRRRGKRGRRGAKKRRHKKVRSDGKNGRKRYKGRGRVGKWEGGCKNWRLVRKGSKAGGGRRTRRAATYAKSFDPLHVGRRFFYPCDRQIHGCNKYCSSKSCNNLGRNTCHSTPTKTKNCCFECAAELEVEANPKERRTLSKQPAGRHREPQRPSQPEMQED